jgi:hypothetical protein
MALQHPFITNLTFDPAFDPIPDNPPSAADPKEPTFVAALNHRVEIPARVLSHEG